MTGSRVLDKVVLGLNLALILGALALFLVMSKQSRPLLDPDALKKDLEMQMKEKSGLHVLPIAKMTMNLIGKGSKLRFLDIEMHVSTYESTQLEELKADMAHFQDIVIMVAAAMDPEELNGLTGKIILEDRIKKKYHEGRETPLIKKLFYTKYVIQ